MVSNNHSGTWDTDGTSGPPCSMHRRLEDRIRELCAKALTAQEPELDVILYALRSALREHAERLRRLAAAKLVSIDGNPLKNRRSA